jgi:hypothetical protein
VKRRIRKKARGGRGVGGGGGRKIAKLSHMG